jgi:hypothetical protein
VQLGPLGTASTDRPIVSAPDDYDDGGIGGMMIGRGNRSTRRKPAPVPLCPPQTPHACPDANPGRRGGKPVTNRLSYGTAPASLYCECNAEAQCVGQFQAPFAVSVSFRVCLWAARWSDAQNWVFHRPIESAMHISLPRKRPPTQSSCKTSQGITLQQMLYGWHSSYRGGCCIGRKERSMDNGTWLLRLSWFLKFLFAVPCNRKIFQVNEHLMIQIHLV